MFDITKLPKCSTPGKMLALPDLALFRLDSHLAIRVDQTTALLLIDKGATMERHGLALGFNHEGRWWYQHLLWSVRGARRKYWPALVVLYRHIRRHKVSPQKLRSLAGAGRSRSSPFAWGTDELRRQLAWNAAYAAHRAFQADCQQHADALVQQTMSSAWHLHRRDTSAQRVLIAKRQVGGRVVEVTMTWADAYLKATATSGQALTGYDPSQWMDQMKLRDRRTLFDRFVHSDRDVQDEPTKDSLRLAGYACAVQFTLEALQATAHAWLEEAPKPCELHHQHHHSAVA